jgi:enoyl-CoA hydratase/carnithine racemase
MSGRIRVQTNGHVTTITLDHPERKNAMNVGMWQALAEIARDIGADEEIRVVIVRGTGNVAFSAGADISEFSKTRSTAEQNHTYDRLVGAATSAIAQLPQPTVAHIHGFCLGGGLAIALSTDLRLASTEASFAIPAARLGVGYGAEGMKRLVGLVGPTAAKRLLFVGDRVNATAALTMGLVNEIHAAADLDLVVKQLCSTMSQNAPLTLRAAKLVIDDLSATGSVSTSSQAAVEACFDSEDFTEGVRSFMQKRPPKFKGN